MLPDLVRSGRTIHAKKDVLKSVSITPVIHGTGFEPDDLPNLTDWFKPPDLFVPGIPTSYQWDNSIQVGEFWAGDFFDVTPPPPTVNGIFTVGGHNYMGTPGQFANQTGGYSIVGGIPKTTFTWCGILYMVGLAAANRVVFQFTAPGNPQMDMLSLAASGQLTMRSIASNGQQNLCTDAVNRIGAGWFIAIATVDAATKTIHLYIDGVNNSSTNLAADFFVAGTNSSISNYVGAVPPWPWGGGIGEHIFYNDVKGIPDVNKLGNWFNTKYGFGWTDI